MIPLSLCDGPHSKPGSVGSKEVHAAVPGPAALRRVAAWTTSFIGWHVS